VFALSFNAKVGTRSRAATGFNMKQVD